MATKKQQHPSRPSAKQSAADRAMRQRLEALALGKQMETIARIHSRSVTNLNVVRDIGAPGGSNEGAIYLDAEELPPPVTRDAIATWIGVTMHEVGHTRWSPSMRQFPSHLQRVYNLAEDARQERLVLEAYPGAVTALTRAVADLIIAQPGMTSAGLWPLLAGRLYLPDELRRAVFDGAVMEMGVAWADEVRDLIADYCDLVDPGFAQNAEACSILVRLRGLLDELPEMPQSGCNAEGKAQPEADAPGRQVDPIPRVRAIADEGEDGDGEDGDGEDGDGNGGDKSDADADADSDGGAGESPDDGDGDGEDGGGGSSESESESDGDGKEAGDGDGKSNDTSDASSDSPGKGSSAGGPKTTPQSNKQRKEVEKEAKAVSEDAGVKLGKLAEAVLDRVRADAFGAKDVTRGSQYAVASESRQAAARLMSSLKPLIDAAEAGLEKLTASGRVKPHRIERGYRPDHVFDKWQMDLDDAVSAEIVVSVDTSGSMSNWDNQLSQAIWVIRQVAARTAANVTVISWDNTAEVVTSPLRNDTTWSVYRGGGTQAVPMLKLATAIFERSQMDKKWMLVMTDGHVQDENGVASLVARLTAMHVAITPLGFGPSSKPEVFGDNARKIESLLELPKVIGALLYDLYRSNVVR